MFEIEEFVMQLAVKTNLSLEQSCNLVNRLLQNYRFEDIKKEYEHSGLSGLDTLNSISKLR